MSNGKPTLKEVAERAGVSVSAASRILGVSGNTIRLCAATIEKVRAVAAELGYQPHLNARNLRLGKSNIIGVCLSMPETDNSDLTYRLLKGISETAMKAGKSMLVYDTSDPGELVEALKHMLALRVDGIVLTHNKDGRYKAFVRQVIKGGTRVVATLDLEGDLPCPRVIADDARGGELATEYLIGKGCVRIAYIGSLGRLSSGVPRWEGYVRTLESHGLPVIKEFTAAAFFADEAVAAAKKMFAGRRVPDGVFVWSDKTAVAVKRFLDAEGFAVPVIGYNNNEFLRYVGFPMPSVYNPFYETGVKAVELLVSESYGTESSVMVYPKIVLGV